MIRDHNVPLAIIDTKNQSQKDHKLGYRPEGGATVGLLEQASDKDWEMFTCLNSLRDVEGTVDMVLDQRPSGLQAE